MTHTATVVACVVRRFVAGYRGRSGLPEGKCIRSLGLLPGRHRYGRHGSQGGGWRATITRDDPPPAAYWPRLQSVRYVAAEFGYAVGVPSALHRVCWSGSALK